MESKRHNKSNNHNRNSMNTAVIGRLSGEKNEPNGSRWRQTSLKKLQKWLKTSYSCHIQHEPRSIDFLSHQAFVHLYSLYNIIIVKGA